MNEIFSDRLWLRIELAWAKTGAWRDFLNFMRQALVAGSIESENQALKLPAWTQLPALCCQAAGGDPSLTDDISAAWFLFYAAAHLMDSVEDHDTPEPWWAEAGPGVALNVATGLYFSASLALNHLYLQETTRTAAPEIVQDFYNQLLITSSGQHLDLISPNRTLEQYWQIVTAKSGAFFSLACRAGAQMATRDISLINAYADFGLHLGVLIQIHDDLEDLQAIQQPSQIHQIAKIKTSLPVIYALEVFPLPLQSRLSLIEIGEKDPKAALEAFQLLEQNGAALYMVAELERHQVLAQQSLAMAAPDALAAEALNTLLLKKITT